MLVRAVFVVFLALKMWAALIVCFMAARGYLDVWRECMVHVMNAHTHFVIMILSKKRKPASVRRDSLNAH